MPDILLVEDEPSLRITLADTFADNGYQVTVAPNLAVARAVLADCEPQVIICDLRLPDGDGMELLREVKAATPSVPFLILTAFGTVNGAVEAMRAGADEYLTKPFEESQLLAAVGRHVELRRLRQRVRELEEGGQRPIGDAPSFRAAMELAATVADSDVTVLLQGETGTGKEVLARFIHDTSRRRDEPFVAVNCAALPEALLESELFGHEKGAFTGAIRQHRGRFELAGAGTLLLDEVAEMSPAVQAKLLRVLQEQTFERLGGSKPIHSKARVIAATRRDLAAEMAAGRFRDDLYYRLKVVPITIPPLRERPGDVILLADHFAARAGEQRGEPLRFAPEALDCLARYPWPGNVRELEHLVRRLAAVVRDTVITSDDLPDEYRGSSRTGPAAPAEIELTGTLAEMMEAYERRILEHLLARCDGHRGKIAELLGITRKNLWEKLKRHGLGE